MNITVQYNWST